MPLGRTARHRRRPPPGCRVLDRDLQQRMAHPTPRPQDPTRSIHLNPRRGGSMKQTRTLSNEPGAVHSKLDECRRRVQNETLGHRGHKEDPLYRARRLLTKAHERLDEAGENKLLGLLKAGDPKGEVQMTWHAN